MAQGIICDGCGKAFEGHLDAMTSRADPPALTITDETGTYHAHDHECAAENLLPRLRETARANRVNTRFNEVSQALDIPPNDPRLAELAEAMHREAKTGAYSDVLNPDGAGRKKGKVRTPVEIVGEDAIKNAETRRMLSADPAAPPQEPRPVARLPR